MNLYERRQRLLEVLCLRRHDTYANLARDFSVSKMTIRRDVMALSCSYPIETASGRFGGVKVMDGYYHHNLAARRLTPKQMALLRKLRDHLTGDDLDTINSILAQFAP